jgi:rRNA maturation protein Nop10
MSAPPPAPAQKPPQPQQQQQQEDPKKKLNVFTIEECPACGQKTKRPFQIGDYITKDAAKCTKCGNVTRITLIYAEPAVKAK